MYCEFNAPSYLPRMSRGCPQPREKQRHSRWPGKFPGRPMRDSPATRLGGDSASLRLSATQKVCDSPRLACQVATWDLPYLKHAYRYAYYLAIVSIYLRLYTYTDNSVIPWRVVCLAGRRCGGTLSRSKRSQSLPLQLKLKGAALITTAPCFVFFSRQCARCPLSDPRLPCSL